MDWSSRPKWTYDPTRDTHRSVALDEAANNPVSDSSSDDCIYSEMSDSGRDDNDDSLSSDENLVDSVDSDGSYVWPSTTYRYEALAYSTPFKALAAVVNQEQSSVSAVSTMTIHSRTPRWIIMGQHRVSTLRVLVRLTTEVHKDVFDGGRSPLGRRSSGQVCGST